MNRSSDWISCIFLAALFSGLSLGAESLSPSTSSWVKSLFSTPPRAFSTAPLWVWNDSMTADQVVGTMRDLAGQEVKQVFIHPRPGLMTPYLSDEWFRLWKVALKEAEKLDMNVWIYDENSYPSGFAGGFVPEAMPESRGRGLGFKDETAAPKWSEDMLAVYRISDSGYENITERIRTGESLPQDRYLIANVLRARLSPWNGGKWYVDLLYPGVTEKFLAITLDAYKREIGSQFGKRVPGSFTDEPELRPAGGLPWTDKLPQLFEDRWGYRLMDHLPALQQPLGDYRKIRQNYYQLLLEQFIERWAKPYYQYCEKNKLEFTGHYWEHEWPNCISVPDNMAMSAWQQRPGIDTLMNQYREDTHAQFGNVRAVKEVASVANQLGMKRTLCELYGAGGWDLRFEDMKRIGDWLLVLGINTLDQHLSYVTLRGARKRDHPQSFSYHEPWWEAYHTSASYLARLSAALSSGKQVNEVLVIEPTTTAWMYNSAGKNPPELEILGESFQKLIVALEKTQVEYDIGCEDVMARHGEVQVSSLRIGQRLYKTVIVPPLTETLNSQTIDLLERYLKAGGTVLAMGAPPERADGSKSERGAALAKYPGWKSSTALPTLKAADGFAIVRGAQDQGILFHHRRELEDGQILFLVNTSSAASSSGGIESPMQGVELWEPETGKVKPYPFEKGKAGIRASFHLPPSGSLLLFLSRDRRDSAPMAAEKRTKIDSTAPPDIRRVAPNVLTLDYVDVTAGGETQKDVYFYQASQFAFRKNGMDRNPWDSAVQFRDELIKKTFPPGSGVEASYHFKIEGRVPSSLFLVVERPDLYTITCNRKALSVVKGDWWLDKAFGKIDITRAAHVGENIVTLNATPFTMYHELESAYVLGDFRLEGRDSGFVIVPESGMRMGEWNSQGYPFYAAGVSYAQSFKVPSLTGSYRVALAHWYGSVAKVIVNGKVAGFIGAPPWECDVTRFLRAGENKLEVVVIGTLKNTLGPHHGKPQLGTAWPAMFQKAPVPGPPPGNDYSTVGYGLMEPFALIRVSH